MNRSLQNRARKAYIICKNIRYFVLSFFDWSGWEYAIQSLAFTSPSFCLKMLEDEFLFSCCFGLSEAFMSFCSPVLCSPLLVSTLTFLESFPFAPHPRSLSALSKNVQYAGHPIELTCAEMWKCSAANPSSGRTMFYHRYLPGSSWRNDFRSEGAPKRLASGFIAESAPVNICVHFADFLLRVRQIHVAHWQRCERHHDVSGEQIPTYWLNHGKYVFQYVRSSKSLQVFMHKIIFLYFKCSEFLNFKF